LFPRTPGSAAQQAGQDQVNDYAKIEGVRKQIARTLREFGFMPRGHVRVYQKPHPEYFDAKP
jgi:hypothetical protein